MSAATESVISEMVERLVREFDPLKIVLFGSHARGQANEHSDVDLLVVMPDGVDRRNAPVQMLVALADMPLAKDVVVTTPEEILRRGDLVGTVLRPALREGRVVHERG